MGLENARIIVDIKSMGEAKRVEESIKMGYVDAIIENIVYWIGVEEDLAESYEKIAASASSPKERDTANKLHILSCSDADVLRKKLAEFEGFSNASKKRIKLMNGLAKVPE
jgi:hypothetical protein